MLNPKEADEQVEKPSKQAESPRQLSAEELRQRASSLARENANLRLMLERLEGERAQLERRLGLLENGVRQSLLRDSEIRRLRFQLQQALGRFRPKSGRHPGQKSAEKQRGMAPPQSGKDALNKLGEPKVDLENLVAEYRKGRKQP
jgi:hypothetical protein